MRNFALLWINLSAEDWFFSQFFSVRWCCITKKRIFAFLTLFTNNFREKGNQDDIRASTLKVSFGFVGFKTSQGVSKCWFDLCYRMQDVSCSGGSANIPLITYFFILFLIWFERWNGEANQPTKMKAPKTTKATDCITGSLGVQSCLFRRPASFTERQSAELKVRKGGQG